MRRSFRCRVDGAGIDTQIVEIVDPGWQVGITVELAEQHIDGCARVGKGIVSALVIAVAVEADGGREIAALAAMKNDHRVDEADSIKIERAADTLHLEGEHRDVEPNRIEAAQVGASDRGENLIGQLAERRRRGSLIVGNAVHR